MSQSNPVVAGIERRVQPRKALRMRADVSIPGDLTIESHTVDLSAGGALIEVPYKLAIGAQCTLAFRGAHAGALRGAVIEGVVRHCTLRGEHFHAGLQFVNLAPHVQAALTQLT